LIRGLILGARHLHRRLSKRLSLYREPGCHDYVSVILDPGFASLSFLSFAFFEAILLLHILD